MNKLIFKSKATEINCVAKEMTDVYHNINGLDGETHLKSIFESIETVNSNLSEAISTEPPTSNLAQKNRLRDKKLRAVFYLVKGYTYHPDLEVSAAAQKIYKVFKHYEFSLVGRSYSTESSLISALLGDLVLPSLQPSIDSLSGCAENIKALRKAQADFEQARVAWDEEKKRQVARKGTTELKGEVAELINNQLVVYLRAMLLVDKEKYSEFTQKITEIIDKNNSVVKKRHKSQSSGRRSETA